MIIGAKGGIKGVDCERARPLSGYIASCCRCCICSINPPLKRKGKKERSSSSSLAGGMYNNCHLKIEEEGGCLIFI